MESVDVAPEADKSQPQKPSPPDEDQSGDGKDDAKKKATVRKRTKTGCLSECFSLLGFQAPDPRSTCSNLFSCKKRAGNGASNAMRTGLSVTTARSQSGTARATTNVSFSKIPSSRTAHNTTAKLDTPTTRRTFVTWPNPQRPRPPTARALIPSLPRNLLQLASETGTTAMAIRRRRPRWHLLRASTLTNPSVHRTVLRCTKHQHRIFARG